MRRIMIRLRLIEVYRGLDTLWREFLVVSKVLNYDLRLPIALLAALIIFAWLLQPAPVQLGRPTQIVRGERGVHIVSLAIAPKGQQMATVTKEGQVALRTQNGGDQTERFLDFPGYAMTAAFSPDGRSLAVAGSPPAICIWDLSASMCHPAKVLPVSIREVRCMMFSPDGRYIATSTTSDGIICISHILDEKAPSILHNFSRVVSLAFSSDGNWLATGAHKMSLDVWDLRTGSRRTLMENGSGPTSAVAFSPDGNQLASVSDFEHHVRLWDLNSPKGFRVVARHTRTVISVAYSPDGSLLATAANDGTVGLWSVATGQRLARLDGQAVILQKVAFTPDGRTLVLATGDDDDLRLWDLSILR